MGIKKFKLADISKFRLRRIAYIALFWMSIDLVVKSLDIDLRSNEIFHSLVIRESLVFIMSLVMGYLFVYTLRNVFYKWSLIANFLAKTFILLIAALLMNFLVHFIENVVILKMMPADAFKTFYTDMMDQQWLLKKTLYWLVLFVITQLYLEINDKYSPGVFLDIMKGKYVNPRVEKRIVMFMDLKDSTPIAEKLGHEKYFLFIRDFIYHVSLALIEKNGIIYQYVGDEIVVSWTDSKNNIKNCLSAVILARTNIQRQSEKFRRKFGIIPDFRVGMHVGDVTIGEIGVIKKDLAMSGDTMNTTARIRSACNELNEKFLGSKEFVTHSSLKDFQAISLGVVELKGKAAGVELFALKI